jgi:hypothetical protein
LEKCVHVKFEVVSVNEVDVTTQIVSNQNISAMPVSKSRLARGVAHGCHGHTHEGVRMIRRHYFDKVSYFHTLQRNRLTSSGKTHANHTFKH